MVVMYCHSYVKKQSSAEQEKLMKDDAHTKVCLRRWWTFTSIQSSFV